MKIYCFKNVHNYRSINAQKNLGILFSKVFHYCYTTQLFGSGIIFGYFLPINYVPKCSYIIRSSVLVV